ncbi:MAG: hypothetical protein OIF50_11445 [Flavobacteriaceae bacterium]|nr:hypothetical protein [Flavobacteriaceae bacterium]
MKLLKFISFVCLVFLLVLGGCSTKKDAFLNRTFHAVTTKNNVLFNGREAFALGRQQLLESYKDNFWEILPVEPMEVLDTIVLGDEARNSHFQKAEEKATKAIQKHSMQVKGEERNPKMDDAFLLLGKARYFDQRFLPAIEAFNYVLYKFAESNKRIAANIWREKVNIRLENEELAIKNIKRLFRFESLSDQEYADAAATLGQAYINLKYLDSAVASMKIASNYTKKKEEKGRYAFIVGQLYNALGKKDSANYAFDKVISYNRTVPRKYMLHAEVEKAVNFDYEKGDKLAFLEHLYALEENRENRPFLHRIYRRLAAFYFQQKNDSLGVDFLNKSLRKADGDKVLLAYNYQDLADHYFYGKAYAQAGKYYDSVLLNINKNTRLYRSLKKRNDNLGQLIKYENTVAANDSIIGLYSMSAEERKTYFEDHILMLQEAEEKAKEAADKKRNAGMAVFSSEPVNEKGAFYFYNTMSLGYGKNEFKTRWGDRPLEDDWRWSDKSVLPPVDETVSMISPEDKKRKQQIQKDIYNVDYYISQIPTDKAQIDSLKTERNFANYQLALLYKEKLKEYDLAVEKLEAVLQGEPEKKLVVPSKYNLYKIYQSRGSILADKTRADILENHPKSRYAELLKNPEAIIAQGETIGPDQIYKKMYQMVEQQQYEDAIAAAEKAVIRFNGDAMVPKFEMLKANAQARLNGFEAYKKAIQYVALNFPNSPEGKTAQTIIDQQLPKMEQTSFSKSQTGKWKLVYPFQKLEIEAITKLISNVQQALEEEPRKGIKISKDVYDQQKTFVVIHGFLSKDFAEGFAEYLSIHKKFPVNNENFVILTPHYKVVQMHKNLDAYFN